MAKYERLLPLARIAIEQFTHGDHHNPMYIKLGHRRLVEQLRQEQDPIHQSMIMIDEDRNGEVRGRILIEHDSSLKDKLEVGWFNYFTINRDVHESSRCTVSMTFELEALNKYYERLMAQKLDEDKAKEAQEMTSFIVEHFTDTYAVAPTDIKIPAHYFFDVCVRGMTMKPQPEGVEYWTVSSVSKLQGHKIVRPYYAIDVECLQREAKKKETKTKKTKEKK